MTIGVGLGRGRLKVFPTVIGSDLTAAVEPKSRRSVRFFLESGDIGNLPPKAAAGVSARLSKVSPATISRLVRAYAR